MKQINISKMNGRQRNEVVTFPHVEALNEVTILSKLDNQYIVKYFDSFIDKQVLCIIMEYCDMGDLHCFLKGQLGRPLTENQVWRFLIQMCMGLSYLHRSKILHRDIKSMNIFLCRDQAIRIGDLGVAKVLSD
jgi:NIMA (never in mitosis gene a)-related kinase